jgi:transcriptional regulator with XRE-family HTH domain
VVNSAPVRKEFARLLKVERLRRGYTQLRLAREAAKFTADKRFASHMIGVYERTMTLPGDVHLCAIAKALGKEPKDLLAVAAPDNHQRAWQGRCHHFGAD